ncbi:Uncharacterized protein Adt_12394 [Abeliophyllum distichum]|uniref:Uncharacterized protein n=1 Tax=Abeliophyllum distichum TaxID=126358 RepID=A0ABD1UQL3_9LAMI
MIRTNDDRKTIETTIVQSDPIALQQSEHEGQYSIYWEKSSNWRSNRKSDDRQKRCTYYRMTNHIVGTCYFIHGFPPGHKFHGKDVKPRNKCFTNTATASTLDPKEGKMLTAKEYEQIMTLLNNRTGFDYEEDDWLGKPE